jgi:protein-S-isoprenylcysteine O-methyltransferase Ste14
MEKLIAFAVLSIPVIIISFRSIKNPGSHGFYRFFGWEGMLWLIVCNIRFWFHDPFSIPQVFSWIFLFYALYLVIAGVLLLHRKGKAHSDRQDPALYSFEKTTEVVDTGLYKYIRHPLYASLFFLTWGICLKHPTILLICVALFSSVMFYLTSRMDEKECVAYFGETYREYMKRTKMFVPYVF